LKVKVNFGGLRAVYVWKNIYAVVLFFFGVATANTVVLVKEMIIKSQGTSTLSDRILRGSLLHTHTAIFQHTNISQGSVATRLKCSEIINNICVNANLLS